MPGLAFTGQGAPGLMTGGSITWGQLCREGCYSRSMTCEEKQVLVKQSHSGLIAHSSTGFHPDAIIYFLACRVPGTELQRGNGNMSPVS